MDAKQAVWKVGFAAKEQHLFLLVPLDKGGMMGKHRALGLYLHILSRKTKKISSKPAPFIHCGEVDFVSWEREARYRSRGICGNPGRQRYIHS